MLVLLMCRLALLAVLSAFLPSVAATKCYICSSYLDMRCMDPFTPETSLRPLDCTTEDALNATKELLTNFVHVLLTNEYTVGRNPPREINETHLEDHTHWPGSAKFGAGAETPAPARRRLLATLLARQRAGRIARDDEGTPAVVPTGDVGAGTPGTYTCWVMHFKSYLDRTESFRGCLKDTKTEDQICNEFKDYNAKSKEKTIDCKSCKNSAEDKPCNAAATALPTALMAVVIGVAVGYFSARL